jgi:hypothetical protein
VAEAERNSSLLEVVPSTVRAHGERRDQNAAVSDNNIRMKKELEEIEQCEVHEGNDNTEENTPKFDDSRQQISTAGGVKEEDISNHEQSKIPTEVNEENQQNPVTPLRAKKEAKQGEDTAIHDNSTVADNNEFEIVDLTLDETEDETEDRPQTQHANNSSDRKRHRAEEASLEEQDRKPRKLAHGHSGRLSTCSLKISEGRTRVELSKHIARLGLRAKFSQGAASTYKKNPLDKSNISHITLNSGWNHLPKNESESLEWWLGEGNRRLQLVSSLDPTQYKQSKRGIPIFWAEKRPGGKKGGDPCHYVGHYRCVQLHHCTRPTIMKGEPRQALLEFQFVRFDENLAARIADLPST